MKAKSSPTKVILVGCGAVTRMFYGPALVAHANTGLLSVGDIVDPDEGARSILRERFPTARSHSSIDTADIRGGDLVIVASPPRFHAEHSIAALGRGAAVLCEKPMAVTSAEALGMIEAARHSQAILAVGLYKRFFPATQAIHGIIQRSSLGKLVRFHIAEGGKFSWQAATDSFFKRSLTPGGVLYDIGVHVLDLVLWWLGEPSGVTYKDDAMGGLEANCLLQMQFPSGCHGRVQLSRDWETQNTYEFEFERGSVRYRVNHADRIEIKLSGMNHLLAGKLTDDDLNPRSAGEVPPVLTNPQCFTRQIQNVVRAVRGEEELVVDGAEGIRSLRLIEDCYSRRQFMRAPWMVGAEEKQALRFAVKSPILAAHS